MARKRRTASAARCPILLVVPLLADEDARDTALSSSSSLVVSVVASRVGELSVAGGLVVSIVEGLAITLSFAGVMESIESGECEGLSSPPPSPSASGPISHSGLGVSKRGGSVVM